MSREAEHSAEVSGPPEIKPEEIVLEELIGSGSFGKVYRGRCRSKAVAVKILHKQQFDPQTLAAFRKEVYLMSKIYHPNVCLFMGACTIPGKCMIVTELVAKGNYEVLLHDEKSNIPLWLRMRMARDAALGVNWLHESTPTFIHRDLKSSNLLVDENFRVKICDFGLSCVKQRHQMLKDQTSAKGTPLYMAPEVMMFREFNESSDVYSFGIVLWEILTRKEPFSQFRALDAFREAVCIRHERPPIPPDTLESLKRLIERCWDKDPSHRPNFRELIVMLDHVAIEAAVSDKRGREFWKKYFLTESVVPWDLFIDNFCDFLKIPNKTAAEKNTVPFFNIKCIQALLADNPHQEGSNTSGKVVSMEKFGKILEYFGPMDSPNFLDNLRETLAQKWFHGDTDTADAAAILSSQPPGSFLVRFSNTNAGCFTISQVSVDSTVRHQRVQHVIGKGFQFQNILFPTLQELVANTFNVALACPNYKYMAIFVDAAVGYPLDGRAYG